MKHRTPAQPSKLWSLWASLILALVCYSSAIWWATTGRAGSVTAPAPSGSGDPSHPRQDHVLLAQNPSTPRAVHSSVVPSETEPIGATIPPSVQRVLDKYGGTYEEFEEDQRILKEMAGLSGSSDWSRFKRQILNGEVLSSTATFVRRDVVGRASIPVERISEAELGEIHDIVDAFIHDVRDYYVLRRRQLSLDISPSAEDLTYSVIVDEHRRELGLREEMDAYLARSLPALEQQCRARLGPLKAGLDSYLLSRKTTPRERGVFNLDKRRTAHQEEKK